MFLRNMLQRLRTCFINENERKSRSEEIEQQTRDIISYLQNGEWALLRQQLIFPLRYFLTESFLESGWKAITAAVGPLKQMGSSVVSVGWLFTSVQTPVQFSRMRLAVSFWVTPTGKLLTLQVAPYPSLPWKTPYYGSKDAREVSLTLGRGLRRVHATLTLPAAHSAENRCPCVVLIGGSGPVDRDSTIGALKPFKDLALGLADRGVAVCRFDKLASTLLGKLTISKTRVTLTEEYVYHVLDAVRQVRRTPGIDPGRIILLGHSLGTLIAARLISMDASLAGCILMATPAEPIYRCAIRQFQYLESLDSKNDQDSTTSPSNPPPDESSRIRDLRQQADVADSPTLDFSTPANTLPFGIGPAYWLDCRAFDPLETLKDVRKPVLVMHGGRDYQTTTRDDYAKFRERFSSFANFEFQLYENLNHLFVSGEGTSTPMEYENPENVDIKIIDKIEQWTGGLH